MPIRRFSGSNIVDGVSSQEIPVTTPPPPGGVTPSIPPTRQPFFGTTPPLPPVEDEVDTGALPPPSFWDPNSGIDPVEGQLVNTTNPDTGEVETFRYQQGVNFLGLPTGGLTWEPFSSGTLPGVGGSDPASLAETMRSNLAREAEARRRRALDAASNAASAFLTGTQLSDARRLNAFQESRSLLPFLVDPEQQFFSGLEPGGLVQSALESIGAGRGFQPTEIQHKQLAPAQLAIPPTGEQVGSDIVESIGDIRGAGAA